MELQKRNPRSYANPTSDKIIEEEETKRKNQCPDLMKMEDQENLHLVMRKLNLQLECLTLKDLIDGLYKIFESDEVNIEEVYALMSAYKSNPAEWLKYAKFDRFRYTRNLVDAGNGKFNLMVLCWGEGHGSSIHDHANAHCFMKILAGNLCEVRFDWPENGNEKNESESSMKELSRTVLPTNDVCYINDSLGLHRVENLSYSDCAVSLHLYSPPFKACKVFNERTGHSMNAPVTFWSAYGKRNKKDSFESLLKNLPPFVMSQSAKLVKPPMKCIKKIKPNNIENVDELNLVIMRKLKTAANCM